MCNALSHSFNRQSACSCTKPKLSQHVAIALLCTFSILVLRWTVVFDPLACRLAAVLRQLRCSCAHSRLVCANQTDLKLLMGLSSSESDGHRKAACSLRGTCYQRQEKLLQPTQLQLGLRQNSSNSWSVCCHTMKQAHPHPEVKGAHRILRHSTSFAHKSLH